MTANILFQDVISMLQQRQSHPHKCILLVYRDVFHKQQKELTKQRQNYIQQRQIIKIKVYSINMKDKELRQLLLSKEELNLHSILQEYILQQRKSQYSLIQNQTPNIIGRQYNLFLSILITLVIVFLNYDQLFVPQQTPTQLIPFKNLDEVQRKLQYVFEHTIMKYTILYPLNITQCESFIPFIDSDTLCTQKSISAKIKFTFNIGYKPNYQKLSYNPKNNSISGQWGHLQIISITDQRLVQSQTEGLLSSWSVLEFEQKYKEIKKGIKSRIQQRVQQYINNITQSQNSVDSIQRNIRKSLMRIIRNAKQQKIPLSNRILYTINQAFDRFLQLLSIPPLFQTNKLQQPENLSPDDVTQFYKEQILINQDVEKINTQISTAFQTKNKISKQTKKQQKQQSKQQSKQQKQQKQQKYSNKQQEKAAPNSQVKTYTSEQIRLKYNQLLKKVK